MKKINQFEDVNLTLFNEQEEDYHAGELRTLIHTKKGIKIRWAMDKPLSNIHPLTHAVLHRGEKIWSVVGIRPVTPEFEGTELEINYDY